MDDLIVGSNRKVDPSRRAHLKPDNTPNDNDRVEIGPTALAFTEWENLGLSAPDMPALREYRLSRLQDQIRQHDCAGLLLFDPLNIRYATDTTNMQLWIAHNMARACFVPPEGKVILWDFHNCEHLSAHLPLVGEVRHGASFFYFETGVALAGPKYDHFASLVFFRRVLVYRRTFILASSYGYASDQWRAPRARTYSLFPPRVGPDSEPVWLFRLLGGLEGLCD